MNALCELNFDGLVGPTHHYGGLSHGNLASTGHQGRVSNPRAAALEGLAKMRLVHGLGVGQAVLPPPPRPHLPTLHRLGFRGSDEQVLARAARQEPRLLQLCSSSSAMWAANAATVAPSCDTADGRVHIVPANLCALFHRAIEPAFTTRLFAHIFADPKHFQVHTPLPATSHLADEGAANHSRLATNQGVVHLFAWGRSGLAESAATTLFPARQTHEASRALSRLLEVEPRAVLWRQDPRGIDAGAFHSDVLAVANERVLLLHELAFAEHERLLAELHERLGPELHVMLARQSELPVAEAVRTYPFNSQLLTLPTGRMTIVAPEEARESTAARAFLERVVSEQNPVESVHFLNVRQSMDNGGGPACLRLRVPLTAAERARVHPQLLFSDALGQRLEAWVTKHYRDRLTAEDLSDPALWREIRSALDELAALLGLSSVYQAEP